MDIKTQLAHLFELAKELSTLLDNEEYETFQQQQHNFSDQIKAMLDHNSPEVLSTVVDQLKQLESAVEQLQTRSEKCFLQLKKQALLQQRNKKKIKAYK